MYNGTKRNFILLFDYLIREISQFESKEDNKIKIKNVCI